MNIQYDIRHSNIMRFIAWPFINTRRMLNKLLFSHSDEGKYIRSLKDSHKGERCFIVGNGPSLCVEDLNSLNSEFCFGMNRIYHFFDETTWRPNCYAIVDIYLIKQDMDIISKMNIPIKFADYTAKKYVNRDSDIHYMNVCDYFNVKKYSKSALSHIHFSEKCDSYLNQGHTVTYICIELAAYMGFSEIYLIGMDHNFSRTVDSSGTVTENRTVKNHFYSGGDGKNVCQFREGVEYAYELAKNVCEKKNIKIFNATRGGSLEIFERVNLDSILHGR